MSRNKPLLARLKALGCICCLRMGQGTTPPENTAIHHLRTGMGMGQRNDDENAIPLCPAHHQTGGYGVAIHAGQKTWEKNFGTELELLGEVRRLLDVQDKARMQ